MNSTDGPLEFYRNELDETGFTQLSRERPPGCAHAAEDLNILINQIGGWPNCKNQSGPDEVDGSNVILVNTYLIIQLAQRIEELERRLGV